MCEHEIGLATANGTYDVASALSDIAEEQHDFGAECERRRHERDRFGIEDRRQLAYGVYTATVPGGADQPMPRGVWHG
jgi:hypothetical protein